MFVRYLGALALTALLASPADATVHRDGLWNASWYSAGRLTASGIPFNTNRLDIAAHRTLPFGTLVSLRDPDTNRQLTVKICDRGPFVRGRDIDLTRAAATYFGYTEAGTKHLMATVVGQSSCFA